jgi:hypothetical protein
MPISSHLLERVYQLIDASQLQNAEMVLDALVRVDPANILAWEAYLEIYKESKDLERVLERILKIKELSNQDKDKILAYQAYLIERVNESKKNTGVAKFKCSNKIESDREIPALDETIIFELLNEFDYPARKVERQTRRRTRKMFVYAIPGYVWRGVGLLALFYISVKLIVLGYIFGYLILGGFIVGYVFWMRSLKNQNEAAPINITRAFSLESENELYIIDKPITDTRVDKKQKSPSSRIRYLDE